MRVLAVKITDNVSAAKSDLFHLMLLFFQSSVLCVQSPSIIPFPGYPLCLVPHLRSLDD